MSTDEQRGFDPQIDRRAPVDIGQMCMACKRGGGPCMLGGACAKAAKHGFPYVDGTTMPCGLSNCGIPEQPYLDQLAFVTPASMDGSVEREQAASFPDEFFYESAAHHPMKAAPKGSFDFSADPYYFAPYADGRQVMGAYEPQYNTLTNDFDNDSIVAMGSKTTTVVDHAAWEKQQLSESIRRPLIEAPIVDPLYVGLGQQAATQATSGAAHGKIAMTILGAGALVVVGYIGYRAYGRSSKSNA